ncbi:MAG: heme o synthase [Verrucomicrobia bacterium]|nr:heme o synthase [Verrucomicrobiota bacterium]
MSNPERVVSAPVKPAGLISDLSELSKARLSFLVLLTTLVGFLLGWRGPMDYTLLGATLLGTALSAAGASALNQWLERDLDALMSRTADRPLPARRMHPSDALLFGLLCSASGVALLGFVVNPLTALLAGLTIAIYAALYTPMKRFSELNTLLGAIPGALPPLLGWTAATGHTGLGGWILFLILWFWQMPHFLAIAWLYRDQYAAAGFKMLSTRDPDGCATGWQALIYSAALLAVSLLPGIVGMASPYYFFAALALGAAMMFLAADFLRTRNNGAARRLFFASIIYLPLLLGALIGFARGSDT